MFVRMSMSDAFICQRKIYLQVLLDRLFQDM